MLGHVMLLLRCYTRLIMIIIDLKKIGSMRTVRSIAYRNVGKFYFSKSSLTN